MDKHTLQDTHEGIDSIEDIRNFVLHRYRSIRTERARAIMHVQHHLSRAIRRFLDRERFVELLAPIVGPITDPGIRGAGALNVTFYGKPYVVMTSMILYKQMAVASIPRVYSFSPNVRLEPSQTYHTRRHLAEFYQVDLEVAQGTCELLMDLGNALLASVLRSVSRKCRSQLKMLGRRLRLPPRRLPRISHTEALDILRGPLHPEVCSAWLNFIIEITFPDHVNADGHARSKDFLPYGLQDLRNQHPVFRGNGRKCSTTG